MDLKKVFDINKLTDHELGCVEYVLNSPAYQDVFKPYLEAMRDSTSLAMLDRSEARRKEYPDDFLAGNIVALKGLLELFEHILRETRMERINDSQAALSPVTRYDQEQRSGQHDPVLGANEPIADLERVPPEEDY